MALRKDYSTTTPGRHLWPVLALLLVVVVVPTACVLWFMTEAMNNERLAVKEKLSRAYTLRLGEVETRIDNYWQARSVALEKAQSGENPSLWFKQLGQQGICDSVVIYDASGAILYPTPLKPQQEIDNQEWREAWRLEYDAGDCSAAANAYKAIAAASDPVIRARGLQAQARCLSQLQQSDEVAQVASKLMSDASCCLIFDIGGRRILPNVQWLALQLLGDDSLPLFQKLRKDLIDGLNDYGDASFPSSQRLFLMREVASVTGQKFSLPTLDAEALAGEYLYNDPTSLKQFGVLQASSDSGIWRMASQDGTVVALYRADSLIANMSSLADRSHALPDAKVALAPPGSASGEAFLSHDAGKYLPGWSLQLTLEGDNPFSTAAERQVALYLWIGGLVVVGIVALSLLLARYLMRQMRLTRMKNDLIATVSHELKTPIASMRVLADTLLDGRCESREQERDYMQLIARDNARLSRLIDNFLSFSRMERNRQALQFESVNITELVAEAAEALRERLDADGFELEIDAQARLLVDGDRDALLTILLNLLDNACKYSGSSKRITIRAYARDNHIHIQVEDYGIGISRRIRKKIFERFYQVDVSLSRGAGGCGLGLAIVKFLVDAHRGTIDVESETGKGSTFTVQLPREKRDA
jgi:two-component system, OmpR family, phosphate regulon sensor histidine kinase PhoR